MAQGTAAPRSLGPLVKTGSKTQKIDSEWYAENRCETRFLYHPFYRTFTPAAATPRCQEFSGRGLLAGGPGMGSLRTGQGPECDRRRGGFPLGPSGWRRCLPGKPLVDRWRRLGSTHGWRAMAGRSARKYRNWKQNHPSHGGQFARGATPEGAAGRGGHALICSKILILQIEW